MKHLAIVLTHPIQYYSPLFKLLTDRGNVGVKVFYTWPQAIDGFDDPDFGVKVKWDLPLLDGYDYELVENVSENPSSKSYQGIVNPSLISKLEVYKPDAIMFFGWKFKSHLKAMRHFKGKIPVWFRGDSTLLDYDIRRLGDINASSIVRDMVSYSKYLIRKLVLTSVYRNVDLAFYTGTRSREYFAEYGLKSHQLIFAPHAVDNDRFMGEENVLDNTEIQKKRSEIGFAKDDFVVLFCGKLESKKRPDLLIEAIKQLHDKSLFSSIKLLIVGSGEMEQTIKDNIEMNNFMRLMPFQNQSAMPRIYRLCDLYCLPSQGPNETWGLAVNEAMACGKPVLVSNKVGCAIDLANKKPHHIFKSGDVDSLKSAILDAYNNRDFVNSTDIQENISNWSFEAIAKSIEKEVLALK